VSDNHTARPLDARTYADTYSTAVHEAGHAVAQHRLGHPFIKVTIVPDRREGYLGMALYWEYSDSEHDAIEEADNDPWTAGTMFEGLEADDDEFDDDGETAEYRRVRQAYEEWSKANPEYPNIVSLSGPLAEAYHLRCPVVDILKNGGATDFAHIEERLREKPGACREEPGSLDTLAAWADLEAETAKLLSENWGDILRVAAALEAHPELPGLRCHHRRSRRQAHRG
jgi:hypothetical protein